MKPGRALKRGWRFFVSSYVNPHRVRGKPKVFCIGRNKTGTTSIARAFAQLGFVVGYQRQAEMLLPFYQRGDFGPIIDYCRTAQAFQDRPFSMPHTYRYLDAAYPGSRFILSVRDSADQWYASLTASQAKRFGGGRLPTAEDLRRARHIWTGWAWACNRAEFQSPESDPYAKDALVRSYETHNQHIRDYFAGRPESLLEINVAAPDASARLCAFLGSAATLPVFPWENRTAERAIKRR